MFYSFVLLFLVIIDEVFRIKMTLNQVFVSSFAYFWSRATDDDSIFTRMVFS